MADEEQIEDNEPEMPEYGTLNGKKIKTADVPNLPPADRIEVVVEMNGEKIRPWRFQVDPSEISTE